MAKGTCYLQVVPYISTSGKVQSLKVTNLSQSLPSTPTPGARVVRLEIEIPDDQLLPLTVRALVDDVRLKEEYEKTIKAMGGTP